MKRIYLLLVLALAIACTNRDNTAGAYADLPASAVKEPYDDGTGVVRVSVYDANNTILEQGDYVNGLRQGVYTVYHPNGYIESTTAYLNGKKEGLYMLLDNRGQLLESGNYHDGLLEGKYTVYNRSRLKETRHYRQGKLHGAREKFYANGTTVMERTNYVDGLLDGVARWYDQQGNLTIEYVYKNGELVEDKTPIKQEGGE